MTDADSLHVYEHDRARWMADAGPKLAALFPKRTDGWVNSTWNQIADDYRRVVWTHLDDAQRERVQRLRKVAA